MLRKPLIASVLGLIFALLSTQALAKPSLAGEWQHDAKPTSIRPSGFNEYVFCNEDHDCARGYQVGRHRIEVPTWQVNGYFRHNTIRWSNATTWIRSSLSSTPNISGVWYHSNQPTSIKVSHDGAKFIIVNEYGKASQGYFSGNELVIPSLRVTGKLNRPMDRIKWSNNTEWNR